MSNLHVWNDRRLQDEIEYPYTHPINTHPKYEDCYNRTAEWLVKSMGHFGNLVSAGDAVTADDIASRITISTRICNDSMTPKDFKILARQFENLGTKTRCIIDAKLLPATNANELGSFPDITPYQQILFYRHIRPDKWFIFLVIPSRTKRTTNITIEGYFIGDMDVSEVNPVVRKLQRAFSLLSFPQPVITWTRRLHFPTDFHPNNTIVAFILIEYLHRHGKYLELSMDILMKCKIQSLKFLRNEHDTWLGKLHLHDVSKASHPFVDLLTNQNDKLEDLQELGFMVIDVKGDGNCGYYSLILGLENLGIYTYSVYNNNASSARVKSMLKNRPWQAKVIAFRKKLQEHSRWLLSVMYPKSERDYEDLMWFYAGIWDEREIETFEGVEGDEDNPGLPPHIGLSDAFAYEEAPAKNYFVSTFINETDYHMNPFWAPHVLASLLKMRVIVYTQKIADLKHSSHLWSIMSFDYRNETHTRTNPHIHVDWNTDLETKIDLERVRISDIEFKQKPTIEILYQNRPDPADEKETIGHFQFLRRVICSGVSMPPQPSKTTLKEQLSVRMSADDANVENIPKRNTANGPRQNSAADRPVLAALTVDSTAESPAIDATNVPAVDPPIDATNVPAVDPPIDATNVPAVDPPIDATNVPAVDPPIDATNVPAVDPHIDATNVPIGIREGTGVTTGGPSNDATTIAPLSGKKHGIKKIPNRSTKKQKIEDKKKLTKMYRKGQLKHNTSTRMLFDSKEQRYYTCEHDGKGGFTPRRREDNLELYDPFLVEVATRSPNEWFGPSVAPPPTPPGDSGFGDAPSYLITRVPTLYQQHNKPYCLLYSFASALFYCGFREEAEMMKQKAEYIPQMEFFEAIDEVKSFMKNLVPVIGLATQYAKRTNGHSRKKRDLTWDELFTNLTPYPTIVIPVVPGQKPNHAFCVVDDLIFDSTTQFSLKLQYDSVLWLCNESDSSIFLALRFKTKFSPPGKRITQKYTRQVVHHWKK